MQLAREIEQMSGQELPVPVYFQEFISRVVTAVGARAGVAWLLVSLDLPGVWIQNFRNHAGFYEQYSRTYLSWLVVNPIELALAIGTPVFLYAVSTWLSGTKGSLRTGRSLASFRLWCFVTLAVLWLSGKNSGEAARLWLFLMPWLLWVCGREPEIKAKIVNGPGQNSSISDSAISFTDAAIIDRVAPLPIINGIGFFLCLFFSSYSFLREASLSNFTPRP